MRLIPVLPVVGLAALVAVTVGAQGMPGFLAGPLPNPRNGHVYYLLEASSWSDAQAVARQLEGHLVTINDDDECDWIYDRFSFFGGRARPLWCGLTDAGQEGSFVWVSGETTEFENWAPGEPNPQPEFALLENHVFLYPTANPRERRWRDATDTAVESYLPSALWATVEDTYWECHGLVEVAPRVPHRIEPRLERVGERWALRWEGRAGSTYQVQHAPAPSGPWVNLGPLRKLEGPASTVEWEPAPGSEAIGFFRVILVR